MKKTKFKVGDLVLYKGGLFRVERISKYETHYEFEIYGFADIYEIGDFRVTEDKLKKADWRDEIKILKGK